VGEMSNRRLTRDSEVKEGQSLFSLTSGTVSGTECNYEGFVLSLL